MSEHDRKGPPGGKNSHTPKSTPTRKSTPTPKSTHGEGSSDDEKGELTHLDARGHVRMVNVGEKAVTHRICIAASEVHLAPETLSRIAEGSMPKGDVLATARLAGIQAAKRAGDWIPLAHPMPLDAVEVELTPDHASSRVLIEARVEAHWRTGVEMEAMVAAAAAGLTIYDMCKAIDRGMSVEATRLLFKSGGKSGEWARSEESPGKQAP
jgi:cyclic pyranopterin phosphate synthase